MAVFAFVPPRALWFVVFPPDNQERFRWCCDYALFYSIIEYHEINYSIRFEITVAFTRPEVLLNADAHIRIDQNGHWEKNQKNFK